MIISGAASSAFVLCLCAAVAALALNALAHPHRSGLRFFAGAAVFGLFAGLTGLAQLLLMGPFFSFLSSVLIVLALQWLWIGFLSFYNRASLAASLIGGFLFFIFVIGFFLTQGRAPEYHSAFMALFNLVWLGLGLRDLNRLYASAEMTNDYLAKPSQWGLRLALCAYGVHFAFNAIRLSGAVSQGEFLPVVASLGSFLMLEGAFFGLLSAFAIVLMTAEALQADLKARVLNDPSSGVLSRRPFSLLAQALLAIARQRGERVFLIAVSLKNREAILKDYGRSEEEFALRSLAGLMQQGRRIQDIYARLTRDIFVILLGASTEAEARALMQVIVGRCAHYHLPFDNSDRGHKQRLRLEPKIGIACGMDEMIDLDLMIDKALSDMQNFPQATPEQASPEQVTPEQASPEKEQNITPQRAP